MTGDPRLRERLASLDRALVVANRSVQLREQLRADAQEILEGKSEASSSAAADKSRAERAFARKIKSAQSADSAKEAAERHASDLERRAENRKAVSETPGGNANDQIATVGRDALARAALRQESRLIGWRHLPRRLPRNPAMPEGRWWRPQSRRSRPLN